MKKTKFNLLAVASVVSALAFTSCDNNDDVSNNSGTTGTAHFSATDAAVQGENITGVYLSVKGIVVDGVDDANDAEVMFNSTKTFNLMAYQNGETYGLGSLDLNAGSYSGIKFILDESKRAYVKYEDSSTADLSVEGGNEYEVVGSFNIVANAATNVVADIDLRKAFKETSSEGSFMLRSTGRLVSAEVTGTIKGSVENYQAMKEQMASEGKEAKIVVFAYAQGTYNALEKEDMDGPGAQGRFENSINSAVVNENGEFTLAFMEESDYEIVLGVFEKGQTEAQEDPYSFSDLIQAKVTAGGNLGFILNGLGVNASSTTNISLDINVGS